MKTGEWFVPEESGLVEVMVNLERYKYAMENIVDEDIIDIGVGGGLGTYLYSTLAKSVIGIDYSQEAIENGKRFPHANTSFLKADITKDILPEADTCVAMEVIEHIDNPQFFLKNLRVKKLVFSVPLNALKVSTFHKLDVPEGEKGVEFVKGLITDNFGKITDMQLQSNLWVIGVAQHE